MDYREKYLGQIGACASCTYVRTKIRGKTIHESDTLIPYDGGKEATCALGHADIIYMNDTPNLEAPINECWKKEEARSE